MGSETIDQTLTSMAALTFYPAPHTWNGSHACEHHKLDAEGAETLKQGNIAVLLRVLPKIEVLPVGLSFSHAFVMKYSMLPEANRIEVLTLQIANRGLKRLNTLPKIHIQKVIEPEFESSSSWLYWPHQSVTLVSIYAAPSISCLLEGPKALHFSLTPGRDLVSLMCN